MLKGVFEHEDFCGHRGKIGPGSLQWMTAVRFFVVVVFCCFPVLTPASALCHHKRCSGIVYVGVLHLVFLCDDDRFQGAD